MDEESKVRSLRSSSASSYSPNSAGPRLSSRLHNSAPLEYPRPTPDVWYGFAGRKVARPSLRLPSSRVLTATSKKELKDKGKRKDKGQGGYGSVDESAVSGQEKHDPTLRKEVSKFLKALNRKDGQTKPQPKQTKDRRKGKEKEKKREREREKALLEKPSTKKSTSTSEPDKSSKRSKKTEKKKSKMESKSLSSAANAASVPVSNDPPPSAPSGAPSSRAADRPQAKLPTKVPINPKSHVVFAPTSQWYTALPSLPPQNASSPKNPSPPTPTPAQLASLSSKAVSLHAADTHTFLAASATSSEASFVAKILQSGTLSDRLSALTLLVQSSPVHNTKALEGLRGLGERGRGKGKGGREESLKFEGAAVCCALVGWGRGAGAEAEVGGYFRDQPLLHPGVTDGYFVVWYFEDWFKKYFFSVLQILDTLSLDPLPYVRTQSLALISTLLRDAPEQEHNLLRDSPEQEHNRDLLQLLINKLGDTDKARRGISCSCCRDIRCVVRYDVVSITYA
ncbi:unnamed protein product [Cyclocybe aegerita]|uniref:Uncharacterized protein n=1 Tax=Cyclocybe aegerita TaxID=1973307 RepID=A0A8S0Y0H1_CYCAE|nr:unnamed protein product [Cyclocybe aegerita]